MRIAHCQLESKLGDFDANLEKVVKGLERADKERAEIVSFPGMLPHGLPGSGKTSCGSRRSRSMRRR